MFFIVFFSLTWAGWLVLADKKRWRELFPVSIFASFLGCISDTVMKHFTLWNYQNPSTLMTDLSDDFSVYLVVPYLFIQWLPVKKNPLNMLVYWFLWTGFTIGLERIFVVTNHMTYHKFWCSSYSYLSDWVLFWLFYQFHKIFRLQLLSSREKCK